MSRYTEKLNGGVWTSLDPAMLSPGQLSDGRNFYYLPASPAIWRATGRSAFASATGTYEPVVGLRDLKFDNGVHLLVSHVSTGYVSANVGDTGTFNVMTSGLPASGTQLEVIQHRNRYFLLNGASTDSTAVGSNRVVYLSATGGTVPTIRPHGLLPVQSPPYVVTAGGGVFSQSVTGYYEYWTTEIAKIVQDSVTVPIESAFDNTNGVTTIIVSSTTVVPTINRPAIRNGSATHWAIYRSTKKDTATERVFPTGFKVGEYDISSVTAVQDTSTTALSTALPVTMDGTSQFGQWTTASNLTASGAPLNFSSATGLGTFDPFRDYSKSQRTYGYNFGTINSNITGFLVEVSGYVTGGATIANLTITLSKGKNQYEYLYAGNAASKSITMTAGTAGAPVSYTVGGPTDRWFAPDQTGITNTDLASNFSVIVKATSGSVTSPATSVALDYIKVYVYYGATNSESVIPYPSVVYTFGDEDIQVSKNGPPPNSSTGDIFEDCLVVNDVSDKSLLRYSYPGNPDAFPSTYYMNFETRENDEVRCIKTVNNRLIVGLDSSLWRVNYLPSERDSSFDRGRAMEAISRTYGIVNPMCACTFTPDGPSELLAFVSKQGIHATDGYNFWSMTDGVDWRGTIISTSSTSTPIALINDRERALLLFYFRNDGYTEETYMCLPLSYGAGYWKNNLPTVGGLIHMRNYESGAGNFADLKSAWPVVRASGQTEVYLGYGGTAAGQTAAGAGMVYRENGTVLPAKDATVKFTTRRMYLNGFSKEWEMGEVYGYAGSYTGSPVVTYTAKNTKTNDTGETTYGTKSITLAGQKLHKVVFRQLGEGMRVTMQATASAYSQELIVLDGTNFGLEDAGR